MGHNQRGIELYGHDAASQTRYSLSVFSANDSLGSNNGLSSPSVYGHFQKYFRFGSGLVSQAELGAWGVLANYPTEFLTLNGAPIGTLPLAHAVRIPTGVCSLKVTAPGYVAVSRLVQIASGEHAREVLLLQPEAIVTAPVPETPVDSRARTAAWAVLAGSGAALATGIVANVVRQSDADQYNTLAGQYNATCTPHCSPTLAVPSHSDVDLFTGVAVAGYAASALLGVTAAILFLRAAPHPSSRRSGAATEPTRPGPSFACGLGPLSAGCAGVF